MPHTTSSRQRKLRRKRETLNRERALRKLAPLNIPLGKGRAEQAAQAKGPEVIPEKPEYESGIIMACPGQPWKRGKTGPSGHKRYPTWIRKDA